jgi:hypothetical protein
MEFVDTFDQLREIAQIVRKCPTATLKGSYIRALRDFCADSHWLRTKVVMDSSTTTSGTDGDYSIVLGDDQQTQMLDIIAIRGDIIGLDNSRGGLVPIEFKIRPGDPDTWRETDPPRQPRWYAYKPEGMFNLHPLPDIVYDLIIRNVIVSPKEGAERVPRDLLKKYNTVIQAGALSYLLRIPGQPWTDKVEARDRMQEYKNGITDAKIEAQRAFNTGAQRVRPVRFLRL